MFYISSDRKLFPGAEWHANIFLLWVITNPINTMDENCAWYKNQKIPLLSRDVIFSLSLVFSLTAYKKSNNTRIKSLFCYKFDTHCLIWGYRNIYNWCTEIYLKSTIEFCKNKRLHASFLSIFNGTLRKSIALRSIYVGRLLQNIYHQPCMFKISQIIVIVLNLTAHESC